MPRKEHNPHSLQDAQKACSARPQRAKKRGGTYQASLEPLASITCERIDLCCPWAHDVEPLSDATCLREALRRRQGTPLAGFFSSLTGKRAQMRKPISRILSREEVALFAWMIISLGFELPRTSSGLPEDLDRASRFARHVRHLAAVFLFGLAPGDAYRAGDVATTAVGSYPAVSPLPEPRRPDGIPSRRPSAV